jgi:hypothetical protein
MKNYIKDMKDKNELDNFLNKNCNDGLCYIVSIVFGRAYICSYKYPSIIPYNEYSRAYEHKYYKNGIWYDFPKKTIIKYQNTENGCQ